MAIRRPRRIFRPAIISAPSLGAASARVLIGASLIACVVAAGAMAWTLVPAGPTKIEAQGGGAVRDRVRADPAQVAVVDGGTLRLQDRVVRLLGITAPDRGQTCRGLNGIGIDCGAASTNALAAMVRSGPVDCAVRGEDRMGRALATCETSGTDINVALVAGGWARAAAAMPALRDAETAARAGRRGLWAWDPNAVR